MNQRSKEEIERMNQLLKEIGCDPAPALPFKQAVRQCIPEPPKPRAAFAASPVCGKLIYPSEAEARKAITRRKKRGAGRLRAYKCGDCHGFHITSYFAKM